MTDPLAPRNPAVEALKRTHDDIRQRQEKNRQEAVELHDEATSIRGAIAALDPFDDGEDLGDGQQALPLQTVHEASGRAPLGDLFNGVSIALKLPIDPSFSRRAVAVFTRGKESLETHFPELPEDAPMIAAVSMLKDLGYRLEGQVWFPPEKPEPAPHANTREGAACATLEGMGFTYIEGDARWHQTRSVEPMPGPEQSPSNAFAILSGAMATDDDFAWSWHCNIAMPITDSIPTVSPRLANVAAALLMQHLFNVDTSKLQVYKDLMALAPNEPAPEVLKVACGEAQPVEVEEVQPIERRYCLMPHVAGIAKVLRFEDDGDTVVARPAGADANVSTSAAVSEVTFLGKNVASSHERALTEQAVNTAIQPEPAAKPEGHIEPSVGRKVWLRLPIPQMQRRGVAAQMSVLDGQPVDATIAWVHPVANSAYTYVTVFVIDHDGVPHRLTVPLRQHYQPEPLAREWVEWMPFQVGQAKKGGAA